MAEARLVVTVLFADVAASTALGGVLVPADVRLLLPRPSAPPAAVAPTPGGLLLKLRARARDGTELRMRPRPV